MKFLYAHSRMRYIHLNVSSCIQMHVTFRSLDDWERENQILHTDDATTTLLIQFLSLRNHYTFPEIN